MDNLRAKRRGAPNRKDLVLRARKLRVSPSHLSRVINGERQSSSLILRFQQLVQSEQKSTKDKS
jgi:hypothetical protein